MDLNLHMKMGMHHLERVLSYAPMVEEDGRATVHLTFEDWNVLADTLFHMNTPREALPESVTDYRLANENRIIQIEAEGLTIDVDIM